MSIEKNVLLPAPFGPMTDLSSPAGRRKLTLSTAVSAPKFLVRLRVSNTNAFPFDLSGMGERSLTGNAQTQGTLTAVEDTRVLILKQSDFRNLRAAFPPLDDYLKHISEKIYAPGLRRLSNIPGTNGDLQEFNHGNE